MLSRLFSDRRAWTPLKKIPGSAHEVSAILQLTFLECVLCYTNSFGGHLSRDCDISCLTERQSLSVL